MLLGDWGKLLNLEVLVEVALSSGLGEVTAGPPWESRRAGRFYRGGRFSAFQAGLQVALGKSLNLSDICFVIPRVLKSVPPAPLVESSIL